MEPFTEGISEISSDESSPFVAFVFVLVVLDFYFLFLRFLEDWSSMSEEESDSEEFLLFWVSLDFLDNIYDLIVS